MDTTSNDYAKVRDVYEFYRWARLNRYYYGVLVQRYRFLAGGMGLAIMLGNSSAIASLAVWQTASGKALFAIVLAIAGILGGIAPYLAFDRRRDQLVQLWNSYHNLHADVERAVRDIRLRERVDPRWDSELDRWAFERAKLESQDDPVVNEKWREAAYETVNRELPPESFWWPPRPAAASAQPAAAEPSRA